MLKERDFLFIASGNLGASILGAIFWLLIANILKPAEYGETNYYTAIATLGSVIVILGLNNTITTVSAKGESSEIRNEIVNLMIINGGIVGIAIFLLYWMPTISMLTIGLAFFLVHTAEILGLQNHKRYALLLIAQRATQLSISIILYFFLGVQGILLGMSISFLIFGVHLIRKLDSLSISFQNLRSRSKFIMHSFSLELARNVSVISDKLIIAPIFGYAVLGAYQLGAQFLVMGGVVPSIFYFYLLPREASRKKTSNLLLYGVTIAVVLFIMAYFLLPYVIKWLFPSFRDSIFSAQIISAGIIPLSISLILSAKFLARETSSPVFFGAMIFVSTQILLSITLGRVAGIVGLSLAMVLSLSAEAAYLLTKNYMMKKQE